MPLKYGGPFICDCCGRRYESRSGILAHFSSRHRPKRFFSCDLCGKIYSFKQTFEAHTASSHLMRTFDCDICGKKFSMKNNLRDHVGTHNKKTECRFCNKLVSNMRIHTESVHIRKSKKSPCSFCGQIFYMKKHIKYHHSETTKTYKCECCEKVFQFKGKLIKHKKEKHGFKTFLCHCGYQTDYPTNFKEHQKSPSKLSPLY